jgi:hypothetical protein
MQSVQNFYLNFSRDLQGFHRFVIISQTTQKNKIGIFAFFKFILKTMAPQGKSPSRNIGKVGAAGDDAPFKRTPASAKKKLVFGRGYPMTAIGKASSSPVIAVKKTKLVFGQRFAAGVAGLYVVEAYDVDRQAFIHPILKVLQADEEKMESLHCHGIYNRHHPSIEENEMMGPDPSRPETPGFFKTFVRIYTDETENNHKNLVSWMNTMVGFFNELARDPSKYAYPSIFEFGADITEEGELPPPSHLLVNEDVMKITDQCIL